MTVTRQPNYMAQGLEAAKKGQLETACDLLAKAVEAVPGDLPAHLALGELLLAIRRPLKAATGLEKAVALAPENPQAWFLLGRARYDCKDMEGALTAFHKSYEKGNRKPACYRMILIILEVLHRLDEMKGVLAEALAAHPEDTKLQILAAKYDARNGDHVAALAQLGKIDVTGLEPEFVAAVLFETGHALDKTGKPEEALKAFGKANEMQAKIFAARNFSREKSLGEVKAMAGLDLQKLRQSASVTEDGHRAPVFLLGFPRSGTTLLNRILAAHSKIDVMEERPPLFLVQKGLREKFGPYPQSLVSLTPEQAGAARAEYMELLKTAGQVDPAKVVVDKLPLNIIQVPLIYKLFPDAKIILALRHPCDACLSCYMQNFGVNEKMVHFTGLDSTVGFYADVMALWDRFAATLPLNVHMVRYEDVVDDMEDEAKRLLSFLGLPWEDGVLEYHEAARREGFLRTPSYAQVVQPIYRKARFRWQNHRRFLEPYFEALQPFCERHGYSLEEGKE